MKTTSKIRFHSFPQTQPPPKFAHEIVDVFKRHESSIATATLAKGLTSDQVLHLLAADLVALGFQVETGKTKLAKIDRPVFFGENGEPTLHYQIDGYHPGWRCGIEVEAGRAWMGNAVYRDLIQAALMVDVDHLFLAVSNTYKYTTNDRPAKSDDYANALSVISALYGHNRVRLPYTLTLIGY